MTRRLSSPIFVGRLIELDRLEGAFQLAAEGRAVVVVIAGEAGVGKSRLVDETARRVRDQGGRVLVGRCVELGDVGLPFAPLVDALRQLASGAASGDVERLLGPSRRELARLVPALGVGSPSAPARLDDASTLQASLFEHLLIALDRLAADRPLFLIFEDLHWADGSTRDLVRYLARNLRTERVALVLTYRSDDLHRRHPLLPLVADLDRMGAERIALAPFEAAQVGELLHGILGQAADRATTDRIHARSDGNAFFVEELLAAGGADVDPRLPQAIGDVVGTRVARLGDDAQATLRIAAVVGRRVDHRMLARLSSLDEPDLIKALRQAVDDQLIEAVDDPRDAGYQFRHALVQECLADQLLPAERTDLHRRIAELLEDEGAAGHEAELAHHWYRAHAMPEALGAAVRAARQAAAVGAFAEAEAHGERALELWTAVPDPEVRAGMDHAALLVLVADAAASAGSLARAFALIDRAVEELAASGDRTGVLDALHRSVWYRWDHGDAPGAMAAARRAISEAGPDIAPANRARLLSDLAFVEWDARRYLDQLRSARRAVRAADASGDRVERARARLVLGIAYGELASPGRGHLLTGEALELLQEGPVDIRIQAGVGYTHVLDIAGRARECAEATSAELATAREAGLVGRYGPQLVANLLDALIDLGDLDEAERLIGRYRDPLDSNRAAIWLDESAAEIALLRGDVAGAEAILEMRRGNVAAMGDTDALWMEHVEAAVAYAAGRPLEARALLDRSIARSLHPAHDLVLRFPLERALHMEADLAVEAAARDDSPALAEARRRGRAAAEGFLRLLDAARPDGWEAPFSYFRAVCVAETSRIDTAPDPDAWRAVATLARDIGRRPDLANARFREAEAALATGADRPRVAEALDEARGLATEMGLSALAGQIEMLARRARLGPRRPAAPEGGHGGLSRRELEVLTGVADGLTNREIGGRLFISEKTASVHVTHILDKLGVGSRTEAALAATRLGLLDGVSPPGAPGARAGRGG